jgi:hypothetical protein
MMAPTIAITAFMSLLVYFLHNHICLYLLLLHSSWRRFP